MRYEIIAKQIRESIFIDAPYDTRKDAQEALNSGVIHACMLCDESNECPNKEEVINE
jgi:hypothetical protein